MICRIYNSHACLKGHACNVGYVEYVSHAGDAAHPENSGYICQSYSSHAGHASCVRYNCYTDPVMHVILVKESCSLCSSYIYIGH